MAKTLNSFSFSFSMTLTMVGLHVFQTVSQPVVPAIFVFGDSTAGVGTNNYIPECGAKADMLFNGIDYPDAKPTGRFSNGYNTINFIVQQLGYNEIPPPFLSFVHEQQLQNLNESILNGTNFASGGSGLLDNTGKNFQYLTNMGGDAAAETLIQKSLFIFSVGSNDIFDFFSPPTVSHTDQELEDYITFLMYNYQIHLKSLSSNKPAVEKRKLNAEDKCRQDSNLCPNRTKYLFWDQFHPTQIASKFAAGLLFSDPPSSVGPINFHELAALD
ncbi:hypothetical protein ACJW31_02G211900 [Castanea mollissima]